MASPARWRLCFASSSPGILASHWLPKPLEMPSPPGITSSADPVSFHQLLEMELLLGPDSAQALLQRQSPAGFGSIALSPHSCAVCQTSTGECCAVPSGLAGVGSDSWVPSCHDSNPLSWSISHGTESQQGSPEANSRIPEGFGWKGP